MKRVMKQDPVSGRMMPTVQYTRMQDKDKQLIQQMVEDIQGQSSIVVLIPWDRYCCTGANMTLQPQTVTWSEQERLLIISDEELHALQMTVIGAERASGQYWTIHGMMHDVYISVEV